MTAQRALPWGWRGSHLRGEREQTLWAHQAPALCSNTPQPMWKVGLIQHPQSPSADSLHERWSTRRQQLCQRYLVAKNLTSATFPCTHKYSWAQSTFTFLVLVPCFYNSPQTTAVIKVRSTKMVMFTAVLGIASQPQTIYMAWRTICM